MSLSPHPQIGRIYVGAILRSSNDLVVLQQRDTNPEIANSGKITTFGGTALSHETPLQALERELREELGLCIDGDKAVPVCVIDKVEADGSPTRCIFFLVENIDTNGLRANEGAVSEATIAGHRASGRLSATCESLLRQVELRARHLVDSLSSAPRSICSLTDKAHVVNEDKAALAEPLYAVIDGASPMDAGPKLHPVSDARWLSETAAEWLKSQNTSTQPLAHLLGALIHQLADELRAMSYPTELAPPSGAIAIVRIKNWVMEYVALADVSIAAQAKDGLWILCDSISEQREAYLLELENRAGLAAVKRSVSERRSFYMNQLGGYWVLSNNTTAAQFARFGFLELTPSSRVALVSDGFSRVVDPFNLAGWTELLETDCPGLRSLLGRLRRAENSDPDRRIYRRISESDDATILVLEAPS